MADAAVEFLLDNLKQLLLHYGSLIANARPQVEKLEKDLRLLNAFLKDTTKKRRKSERMRELIREIRDVVYEAEDTVDTFVTQAAEGASRSRLSFKRVRRTPANFVGIARQVEDVSAKVKEIYGDKTKIDFALINVADADDASEENEAPILRQENIVGFDDEADKLIGYLKEETDQLDVISIIGMPGLGKTTLAGKIFRDWRIQYGFPTSIWVYVSQEFTRRSVFLEILKEFIVLGEDMSSKTDQDLAQMVASYLENEKFLIVMDDVWTAEDWDKLKVALPMSNKMGKVLITSRQMEVGRYANCKRTPHNLRFLTEEESWLLLRYEVFGKPEFPSELESYGRSIVRKCDNLPLAIVVIAGILAKKISVTEDMSAVRNTWRKVSQNVNTFIVAEDPTKRMEKIIALSYDKLPYHLRACFLYLGMFPEDFEIPTWKLTRMWTAEGFIQRKDGGLSLEDCAENYLDELINRNLVRVDKRRRDGSVKTCRIHDMLRDFCRTEAGTERENFFHEVKRSREGTFDPPVANIHQSRRLCIHSNVEDFVSSRPSGPRVRSFVYFSKEEINLPAESTSVISETFKLLRVLEVQPIKFQKIPKDIFQLFHLRYITISFDLPILPTGFSKLWNVESLIVETKSRTLDIKADIWKMKQLRHFKTNASAILPKAHEPGDEGENIQSLGTIAPQSCTEGILGKARYVKSLGIRGRLALLLEPRNGSLDSLGKLDKLEKLKLINDVFPKAASENPLPGLPQAYQFPENLRSLTLADTFLDWSHMSSLGFLYNLEVLKLKDKAFMGDTWEAADGNFRKLEVLYIGRTNLVTWTALKYHFPRLRNLELKNCEHLQQVPIGLADIPSFQLLDLYRTTKSAVTSAKKIQQRKRQLEVDQTINSCEFKLSVFPPEE